MLKVCLLFSDIPLIYEWKTLCVLEFQMLHYKPEVRTKPSFVGACQMNRQCRHELSFVNISQCPREMQTNPDCFGRQTYSYIADYSCYVKSTKSCTQSMIISFKQLGYK